METPAFKSARWREMKTSITCSPSSSRATRVSTRCKQDLGSFFSMPFAFFAAISRPRGVADRFRAFAEEDDRAKIADDCLDILLRGESTGVWRDGAREGRRNAVKTDEDAKTDEDTR